eukprot:3431928-Pleurochrysis_carterae.AAC.1
MFACDRVCACVDRMRFEGYCSREKEGWCYKVSLPALQRESVQLRAVCARHHPAEVHRHLEARPPAHGVGSEAEAGDARDGWHDDGARDPCRSEAGEALAQHSVLAIARKNLKIVECALEIVRDGELDVDLGAVGGGDVGDKLALRVVRVSVLGRERLARRAKGSARRGDDPRACGQAIRCPRARGPRTCVHVSPIRRGRRAGHWIRTAVRCTSAVSRNISKSRGRRRLASSGRRRGRFQVTGLRA